MYKLTLCTSNHGRVCKAFNADGSTVAGGQLVGGTYQVLSLGGLDDLERVITQSKANSLLVLGEPANGLEAGKIGLVSNSDGQSKVAVSKAHFKPVEAGFFLVDVDDATVTTEAVISHLEAFSDAFKGVQWLRVNSSSALLKNAQGVEVVRKAKYHLYACATGLGNIGHFVKHYEQWCDDNGLVKYVASKSGAQLKRYMLDVSIYQPYHARKVFEGVELPKGFTTDKEPTVHNAGGKVLDFSGFTAPAITNQQKHVKKQHVKPVQAVPRTVGEGKCYPDSYAGAIFNKRIRNHAKLNPLLISLGYKIGNTGRYVSPEQTTQDSNTQLLNDAAGAYALYCHSDSSPFCGRAYTPFDAYVHYGHQGCLKAAEKAVLASVDDIAHHYEGDVPTTHVGDFNPVVDALKQGHSFYLCAHLGDGKTQTVLNTFRPLKKRILYINHSRSLTADIAGGAKSKGYTVATYTDAPCDVAGANFVITTINSLGKIDCSLFDVIVIDEVLAVTETLVGQQSTLKEVEQIKALELLTDICQGRQTLLLDGDKTPYTHALMKALMIKEVYKVAAQHEQPKVAWLKNTTKKHSANPAVVGASKSTQCAFFSDSKKMVKILSEHEGWGNALTITGDNSGEDTAQAFLQNVEEQAALTPLLAYTSCMGCGVSIVQTARELFGYYCGTVTPQSFYQMSRRYRRAIGTIKISVHHRRLLDDVVSLSEYHEALKKGLVDAGLYGGLIDSYVTIRANFLNCKGIWDSAPDIALMSYLQAVGVEVIQEEVQLSGKDCDAVEEAKNTVEHTMVADVMGARCLTDVEQRAIEQQNGLTRTQTAAKTKTKICKVLGVDDDELDVHTVDRCLFDGLLGKVVAARALLGEGGKGARGRFFNGLLGCVDGNRTTGKQLNHKMKQVLMGFTRVELVQLFKLDLGLSLPDVENDSRFSQWISNLLKHFGLVKADSKKTKGFYSFILGWDADVQKWCNGFGGQGC